jgi:hypothetical protein
MLLDLASATRESIEKEGLRAAQESSFSFNEPERVGIDQRGIVEWLGRLLDWVWNAIFSYCDKLKRQSC